MSTSVNWKAPYTLNYNFISSFMVLFESKGVIVNLYGQMSGFSVIMETRLWMYFKKWLMDERTLMNIIRMGQSSNLYEPSLETPNEHSQRFVT